MIAQNDVRIVRLAAYFFEIWSRALSDELSLAVSTGCVFSRSSATIGAQEPKFGSPAQIAKCAIDLVFAAGACIVLLPVFFIVALAVRLDGGPIFYVHPRVGRGGRLFNCYKFRSMRVQGDSLLDDLLRSDSKAAELWKTNRKLRNDPRVTPVGKILRKTSLDELPQLFNVLRMDMSLVGPRPIVEQEIFLYGAEVSKYYSFRPGLTGVWQISGRSDTSFRERVRFDSSYVDNWSIWLDLRILLKTVPAVVFGLGAH